MLKRISLLATMFVSIFALSGCYVGTYSGTTTVASSRAVAVSNVAYYGPHPVTDIHGDSDWCNVSGKHYHAYSPDSTDFFIVDSGNYVFIGDPSYYVSSISFDTYYYMGVHPLPYGNHWCYINGPHRHHWASSGYYNYTRVGSYNYYTYYGARNSYYDPGHIHYDLHTYYDAHPPVRYGSNYHNTVGMRDPYPSGRYGHDSIGGNTEKEDSRTVYRPTSTTRPSYSNNSSSNVVNTGVRPATGSSSSSFRPATGSSSSSSSVRPVAGSSSSSVRPATGSSSSSFRPSVNGGSDNSGSFVRPSSSASSTRPAVSNTRPSSDSSSSFVRPSSSASSTRPAVSNTRPSSDSSSSYGRPSSSASSRPSGRVDAPTGKSQYEEENSGSSSNNSGSTFRRGSTSGSSSRSAVPSRGSSSSSTNRRR